jgi:hypothetical protein
VPVRYPSQSSERVRTPRISSNSLKESRRSPPQDSCQGIFQARAPCPFWVPMLIFLGSPPPPRRFPAASCSCCPYPATCLDVPVNTARLSTSAMSLGKLTALLRTKPSCHFLVSSEPLYRQCPRSHWLCRSSFLAYIKSGFPRTLRVQLGYGSATQSMAGRDL